MRSQSLSPTLGHSLRKGTVNLLRFSYEAWHARLLMVNPGVRWDVFAHSWSPEVGDDFDSLWRGAHKGGAHARLVSSLHEPTMWKFTGDPTNTALRFGCNGQQVNCARTASQLLSITAELSL